MRFIDNIIDRVVGRYVTKGTDFSNLFSGALNSLTGTSRLTNKREQMKAYAGWVYGAAATVAKEVATIDIEAYANRSGKPNAKIAKQLAFHPKRAQVLTERRTASGKPALEELESHISLDLLASPNPLQDGEQFMEMIALHLMLAGETFLGKVRGPLGTPVQLWPMMPYLMTHHVSDQSSTLIDYWEYRVNGTDYRWEVDDIIHIKLTDPNDIFRGMSIVKAAAIAIDTDTHSAEWNRNFFMNSARPDVVLETDKIFEKSVRKRLRQQWEDKHSGVGNEHKIAILEGGLKLNKFSLTQKDMDFLEGRTFSRDQILAMFGVSRVMLGLLDGDGRANMDAAEYSHAKRVIKPLDSRIIAAFNHQLAPEFDPKLVFGFADPVPEDKSFLLEERTKSINVYRTVNEVRAEIGEPPLAGGDVLYLPMNLVAMGAPEATPPTEDEEDPLDDPGEDDDLEGKGATSPLKKGRSTLALKSVRH